MLSADSIAGAALLASAVAGRRVELAFAAIDRGHTDGATIFLPSGQPTWDEPALLVQAALIANGGLVTDVMRQLTGHRRLQARYLVLETARAAATQSDVLPPRVSAMVRQVVPGPSSSSAQESMRWAQERGRLVPDPPLWFGELKPAKVLRSRNRKPEDGGPRPPASAECAALQRDTSTIDEDDAEHSRVLELFEMPGQSPLSSVIRKMLGMGRSKGAPGSGGGDLSAGDERGDGAGADNALPVRFRLPTAPAGDGKRGGHRYPEWDARRGRWRPDWCAVHEFDPPPDDSSGGLPVIADDRPLRRELAAIGFSALHQPGQTDGDVLDLNALVDFVAERRTGDVREARIYAHPRRTGRDLSVLLLLDATASSADAVAGRRQFDSHCLVVDRLATAMESLGSPVAAYAFTSFGREDVRFLRVKDFPDRYDPGARDRLRRVQPHGFTRLGAAVRHATQVLERNAGTSRRLLVMVGDGFPYELGYEGDDAEADSRQALGEAVARGIGCVRISVDGGLTEDPCVSRIWADLPQRRLADADELARHVRPLFTQATRSATAGTRPLRRPQGHRTGRRTNGGLRP